MSIKRNAGNPIIKPGDVKPSRSDFEVVGAFNPGVARYGDETILLLRVAERPLSSDEGVLFTAIYDECKGEIAFRQFRKDDPNVEFLDTRMVVSREGKFLTSLSHFRIARTKDNVHFEIEDEPAMFPATKYEAFGLEDARITQIGETYYITYVGVSELGVVSCLASTKDFVSFERLGVVTLPDNKDVVLFPEKVGGKYYMLTRPVTPLFEKYEMWLAESSDLRSWGGHEWLMKGREDMWDASKVGAGAVPFRIEQGWIELYHGADNRNRYCLGAVLLDGEDPSRIISRSGEAVLEPETDYEREGFFGNVVFTCGAVCEGKKIDVYYGVADSATGHVEMSVDDVLRTLQVAPFMR